MDFERTHRRSRDLPFVPLVDIVFFLIFYFLVVGSVKPFEILDVNLPQAQSGRPLMENSSVILLGRFNEVVLDDQLVSLEDLQKKLRELFKVNPNHPIMIKADGRLSAYSLMTVMDLIKASGGRQISLVTENPQ